MIDLDALERRVADAEDNAMGDVEDFSRDVLALVDELRETRNLAADKMAGDLEKSVDLEKLEQLARAATPGPWQGCNLQTHLGVENEHIADWAVVDNRVRIVQLIAPPRPANAAFIAATDPTTVLALIARIRSETASCQEAWAKRRVFFHERQEALTAERDQAVRELAAARAADRTEFLTAERDHARAERNRLQVRVGELIRVVDAERAEHAITLAHWTGAHDRLRVERDQAVADFRAAVELLNHCEPDEWHEQVNALTEIAEGKDWAPRRYPPPPKAAT